MKNKSITGKLRCTQISKYIGALIKLLQWCQHKIVDPIYDIIMVEQWPTSVAKNQRLFIEKKIFSLAYLIKRAYVIPATIVPV